MSKPGRSWTGEDIQKLKSLAQKYPTASIANQLGRSVGALAVKAHQLKLSLRLIRKASPSSSADPGPAGFSWEQPRPASGSQGEGQ